MCFDVLGAMLTFFSRKLGDHFNSKWLALVHCALMAKCSLRSCAKDIIGPSSVHICPILPAAKALRFFSLLHRAHG